MSLFCSGFIARMVLKSYCRGLDAAASQISAGGHWPNTIFRLRPRCTASSSCLSSRQGCHVKITDTLPYLRSPHYKSLQLEADRRLPRAPRQQFPFVKPSSASALGVGRHCPLAITTWELMAAQISVPEQRLTGNARWPTIPRSCKPLNSWTP